MSFIERGPAHCVLALALIHHLSITYNLPFSLISNFFGMITKQLIIEFVPKSDPQTVSLLHIRKEEQMQLTKLF
jgi:hypothetical protein